MENTRLLLCMINKNRSIKNFCTCCWWNQRQLVYFELLKLNVKGIIIIFNPQFTSLIKNAATITSGKPVQCILTVCRSLTDIDLHSWRSPWIKCLFFQFEILSHLLRYSTDEKDSLLLSLSLSLSLVWIHVLYLANWGWARKCVWQIHSAVLWLIHKCYMLGLKRGTQLLYNLSKVPLPIGPFNFMAVPIKFTGGTSEHFCKLKRVRAEKCRVLKSDDMYIFPKRILLFASFSCLRGGSDPACQK